MEDTLYFPAGAKMAPHAPQRERRRRPMLRSRSGDGALCNPAAPYTSKQERRGPILSSLSLHRQEIC